MKTVVIGKRGTIVIPAKMRRQYKIDDGSALVLEEKPDGILMRPVPALPEVEIYTQERLAELLLNNSMSKQDYLENRKEVEKLGIDPDSVDHMHWPD